MKTFYILLISCYCTIAICQSELEEIRDNNYGTAGAVDLYAMGFEDCDLIAIDEFNNQYIIDYDTSTLNIIKLQENGEQIMDYGINGRVTIDSVFVQRLMNAKTHGNKLYLLADDRDTMFLHAFTSDGQVDPLFNQGERMVATTIPANYHTFFMDIVEDKIMVAAGERAIIGGALYVIVDQFSLLGTNLATDTIQLTDHPEAGVADIQFRPSDQIYLVYGEREPIDSLFIKVRRYNNISIMDSSFAMTGTYYIPHQNFNIFNLTVQEDELMISYLLDTFNIKHERLNLSGDIIYEHTAPKPETLDPYFLFMDRLGMSLTSEGYYALENVFDQNWDADYFLTKYNSDLELDTSFGENGRYFISKIARWRSVDALERVYITMRSFASFTLVRTGPSDLNALEEIEDKRNNFRIYPNPTNSIIDIEIANNLEDDILCKVFDLKGNLISSQHFSNSNFQVDLSNYPQGIYLINLVSSAAATSQLVFKQ